MGGHIKLDRKILNWEWYTDVNTCKLFLHLLLKANWEDGRFQGVEVPRGSFASSYQTLATETGLSIKNVRTALEHLQKTGEVAVNRHPKFSVFTVKNYCLYQSTGSQVSVNRQATGSQVATMEEEKKEINNNNIYIYAYAREEEPLRLFEDFWQAYPKRVSRMLAEQAYVQLLSSTPSLREEQVVAAVKNYAEACKILGTQDRYISLPHNWLEKSVWVDYLPENYKRPQEQKREKKTGTEFSNFEQRDYDFDELEMQLLESQEIGQEVQDA